MFCRCPVTIFRSIYDKSRYIEIHMEATSVTWLVEYF